MNKAYELHEIGDSLAKSGFYIIAIDYYGHGQTPIPSHEVSIYHVTDDIKVLMDHLSIDKAFVGGFSRGGYIATAFYDSYPEKVLGLILEDGGSVSANTYFHKLNQKELEAKAKLFDDKTQKPWDLTYRTKFEAFESLYDKSESANQFPILALIRENEAGEWRIIYSETMKHTKTLINKFYQDFLFRCDFWCFVIFCIYLYLVLYLFDEIQKDTNFWRLGGEMLYF